MKYSMICGRIYAYQRCYSGAFSYSVDYSPIRLGVPASIDSPYVSGLSLTHTFTSPDDRNKVFMDDPLWDGEGCGGSSTCCSFNTPPYFCQHLKYD